MLFAGLWVWAGAVPEKGRKDTKFRPIDVNMDSIRVNIQNPRSNYYYKRLWRKYQSNDTNMSLKEYRHLYLGYVFSEDYDPYRQSEFSKKIQPLYYKKHHTPAECDTIIKYAELSLADDPFDLKQNTTSMCSRSVRNTPVRQSCSRVSTILSRQSCRPAQALRRSRGW